MCSINYTHTADAYLLHVLVFVHRHQGEQLWLLRIKTVSDVIKNARN